jgi:hypothetical protein
MRRALMTPVFVLASACSTPTPGAEPESEPQRPTLLSSTALASFADPLEWPAGEAWVPVPLTHSDVTGGPQRLWFHKDTVTAALLAHPGGAGFRAAPLSYPAGSVFFAEDLGRNGATRAVKVLVTRSSTAPDFLLFDGDGARSRELTGLGHVPGACLACHTGDRFFQPMMSFPSEPAEHRVDLDERWRDVEIAKRFLEGYHRADGLFGPYGAIWLARVKSGARDGSLSPADRRRHELLRARYPDLLDEGVRE